MTTKFGALYLLIVIFLELRDASLLLVCCIWKEILLQNPFILYVTWKRVSWSRKQIIDGKQNSNLSQLIWFWLSSASKFIFILNQTMGFILSYSYYYFHKTYFSEQFT